MIVYVCVYERGRGREGGYRGGWGEVLVHMWQDVCECVSECVKVLRLCL